MSEEEKKTLNLLKQTIDHNSSMYIDNLGDNDIRIILNLIKKQQKEIEDSISKDKIREIIKELESHIWKDGYMTKFDEYAIHYLKELIGE